MFDHVAAACFDSTHCETLELSLALVPLTEIHGAINWEKNCSRGSKLSGLLWFSVIVQLHTPLIYDRQLDG